MKKSPILIPIIIFAIIILSYREIIRIRKKVHCRPTLIPQTKKAAPVATSCPKDCTCENCLYMEAKIISVDEDEDANADGAVQCNGW